MNRAAVAFGVIAALSLVCAQRAYADPPCSACGGCPQTSDDDWCRSLRLAPYAEHGFPADLEDERGTLAVDRLGLLGAAAIPVSSTLKLRLAFGAERAWYDLSDPDDVVAGPGRLLEDTLGMRVEPSADVRLRGGWMVSAGTILASQGALGAELEDTLTYGAFASVRFPMGSRNVRLGAGVETTLEDSATFFPIISIGGVSTGKLTVEARGYGVRVGYAFTDHFGVGVAARYDRRDWRLAENDRVPGGVFRDIRTALGADVEWKPNCNVTFALAAWVTVAHRIRVDDEDGDHITKFDADSSWMISAGVVIRL